jgi:hypothetical protein
LYLSDTLTIAPTAACVVSGDTIDALAAIAAPQVALALWQRRTPAIPESLDLEGVDDLSLAVDSQEGSAPVTAALRTAGYPPDVTEMLGEDIASLAAAHRHLTRTTFVNIRLDVIDGDACRRFHADYVSVRMLCTYRGAGTQWCRAAAPETVHTLAAGAVAVFKGRLAMEEPLVLHRSPPLRAVGGQRLLLVIDPG